MDWASWVVGDGQGSLMCCNPLGLQRVGHDWVTEVNWTDLLFMAAIKGAPLNHLPPEARKSCVLVSYGTGAIRFSSWKTATLRAIHRQQTETNQVFLCPETFAWGLARTNRGLQRYSQGMEDSECNICILPLPLSSLPASSRKTLINFFVAQMAMPVSRGYLYTTWLWWLEGLMLKGSIGL